jgi:hypothetical protein
LTKQAERNKKYTDKCKETVGYSLGGTPIQFEVLAPTAVVSGAITALPAILGIATDVLNFFKGEYKVVSREFEISENPLISSWLRQAGTQKAKKNSPWKNLSLQKLNLITHDHSHINGTRKVQPFELGLFNFEVLRFKIDLVKSILKLVKHLCEFSQ